MKHLLVAIAAFLLLANSPSERARELMNEGKDAEAFAMVEQAAETGDPEATTYLAWFYDNGRHVAQDLERAAKLYRIGAEKGDWYAQWRLGVMIDEGTTPGTIEESVELFRKSAAQGSSNAMTSLAVMYASGRGVPQDFGQAHTYYEMAARKGNPHGMQGLGVLYFNGEGVTTDRIEAMAFWLVALTAGNETASGYYQQTSHTYDDAEMHAVIERANELAEEFGYPGGFTPWNVSDED